MGSSARERPAADGSDGPRPRSVLVVDDHRVVAELLALGIDAHPRFHSVGVVTDAASAPAVFAERRPDVVVLDVRLDADPRSGLRLAAQFVEQRPDVRVVLLTGEASGLTLDAVHASGACAVMAKGGSLQALLACLERAEPGRLEIDPELLRVMVGSRPSETPVSLTGRERQVLNLLAEGHDIARICVLLGIRPHTGRGHVKSLLQKLDAHTQLAAVAQARRRGLV